MKKIKFILAALLFSTAIYAQVGIQTTSPDANSDLTLGSTNKGLRLNKVALTGTNDATTVGAHTAGMTVYNTATAGSGTTAVTPGEYYNDGTQWIKKAGTTATFNPTQNVYVNGADPNSATQFDDVNYYDNAACPAVNAAFTHDATLMALSDALYIGQSACDADGDGAEYSYWIYDGSQYIPYNAPEATEWMLSPTNTDAGSNKTANIYRRGFIGVGEMANKGIVVFAKSSTMASGTHITGVQGAVENNSTDATNKNVIGLTGTAAHNAAGNTTAYGVYSQVTDKAGVAGNVSHLIGVNSISTHNGDATIGSVRGFSGSQSISATATTMPSAMYGVINNLGNSSAITNTTPAGVVVGVNNTVSNSGAYRFSSISGSVNSVTLGAAAGVPTSFIGFSQSVSNNSTSSTTNVLSNFTGINSVTSNTGSNPVSNQISLNLTNNITGAGVFTNLRGVSYALTSNSTGTSATGAIIGLSGSITHSSATQSANNIASQSNSLTIAATGKASGTLQGINTTIADSSTQSNAYGSTFGINNIISFANTSNSTITNSYGLYTRYDNSSSGLANNMYGQQTYARNYSTNTGTQALLAGYELITLNSGNNSITTMYGMNITAQLNNPTAGVGGTITNLYALRVNNSVQSAYNGSVTNNYGLFIDPVDNGVNNWTIFSTSDAPSSLGGSLRFSTNDSNGTNHIYSSQGYFNLGATRSGAFPYFGRGLKADPVNANLYVSNVAQNISRTAVELQSGIIRFIGQTAAENVAVDGAITDPVEVMRINSLTQRVGIGTTAPVTTLEVSPTAVPSGNAEALTLTNNSLTAGAEVSLYFAPSNSPSNRRASISGINNGANSVSLKFTTGAGAVSTERIRIDAATGNTGINTTTPGAILDVTYRDASSNLYRATDNAGQYRWRIDQSFNMRISDAAGTDTFGVDSNGNGFYNGNLGIGITTATQKLEVVGGIKIGNSTSTCNAAAAGTIRWTGTAFEKCNGTAWSAF